MKRKQTEVETFRGHDDDGDSSEDENLSLLTTSTKGKFRYTNKQRVLVVASRGITARHRHLLEDLKMLIPHHRKDSKLDSKGIIKLFKITYSVLSYRLGIYTYL